MSLQLCQVIPVTHNLSRLIRQLRDRGKCKEQTECERTCFLSACSCFGKSLSRLGIDRSIHVESNLTSENKPSSLLPCKVTLSMLPLGTKAYWEPSIIRVTCPLVLNLYLRKSPNTKTKRVSNSQTFLLFSPLWLEEKELKMHAEIPRETPVIICGQEIQDRSNFGNCWRELKLTRGDNGHIQSRLPTHLYRFQSDRQRDIMNCLGSRVP